MFFRYLIILFFLIPINSFALIEVDITRGNLSPLPIAVSPLSLDKESKQIFYTIYNLGWQHNTGFKIGLSVKDEIPLLDIGFNKKLKNDDIEYLVGISFKTDLDENIVNIKSEVKKCFTERVNIFALYKKEYYNTQEDFQFKVGVGVKL